MTRDDYLALFGFGVNTALDLPEAKNGLLPTRAWKEDTRGLPWYPGDTVNIGIGQGDMLVTPLQLATASLPRPLPQIVSSSAAQTRYGSQLAPGRRSSR